MKVLQINAVYRFSSTGRNVQETHEYLKQAGIFSYVAATHVSAEDRKDHNIYEIGTPLDWKLHALLSRLTGLQGYFSTRATKKLIQYISKIEPDVVHIGNIHGNFINFKILFDFLARQDIATVITLHDCWFYTGKCTYYTAANCDKWETGCHHCPKRKLDNKSWFFDRTAKMWEDKKNSLTNIPRLGVIGVSDWIAEEASRSFLKNATYLRRIYNWIDLELFQETDMTQLREALHLQDKFVLLGVAAGWYDERKGTEHFFRLAESLKDDEVLIMVGNMPKRELPKNMISIPSTENVQELVRYYSMADVFLQLSSEETFGKVVAEALACGTPVVTLNKTACPELVPAQCGVVVDQATPEAIYQAVCSVRKRTKAHFKEHCRKFAIENFNLRDRIEDHIRLYEDLRFCDAPAQKHHE